MFPETFLFPPGPGWETPTDGTDEECRRIESSLDDVHYQEGYYETLFFWVLISKKDLDRVNATISSFK